MKKNATIKLTPARNGHVESKIKLDLSFGELPKDWAYTRPEGFDPLAPKWSLKDCSVEEAHSAYLFHRIPGEKRGIFMDELWRVLVPQGKVTFLVPYYASARSIQDPFSAWPPMSEHSFLYFNKGFRENNKLPYEFKCDFDFTYGFNWQPDAGARSDEVRSDWLKHYLNAVNDLQVVMTKR